MQTKTEEKMQKTVWRWAGLLALPCACNAFAQSSVTLYGVVSGNVSYVTNAQTNGTSPGGGPVGHHQVAQFDGANSALGASRFGLLGAEDLGGGLKAIFTLESGFSMNTGSIGQGGSFFGRQAWVGLSSASAGQVTLGRQGDAMTDFTDPLTYAYNWGFFNAHPDDYDNVDYSRRINNSLKYMTPVWHGFRFGAVYGFGGVAGSMGANQVWSVGGSYTMGGLSSAIAYVNGRNPNTSMFGNNPNASASGNNMGSFGSATSAQSNPVLAGFASASTLDTLGAAATYKFGSVIVGGAYNHTRFLGLGSNASLNPLHYSGNVAFDNLEGSLRVAVTPAFRVGMSYDFTRRGAVNNFNGAHYQQLNLGADYNLSKATDIYILTAMQKASGTDSLGQAAVASIAGITPSATAYQMIVAVGMRHLF
jgi:predicted porin